MQYSSALWKWLSGDHSVLCQLRKSMLWPVFSDYNLSLHIAVDESWGPVYLD